MPNLQMQIVSKLERLGNSMKNNSESDRELSTAIEQGRLDTESPNADLVKQWVAHEKIQVLFTLLRKASKSTLSDLDEK